MYLLTRQSRNFVGRQIADINLYGLLKVFGERNGTSIDTPPPNAPPPSPPLSPSPPSPPPSSPSLPPPVEIFNLRFY